MTRLLRIWKFLIWDCNCLTMWMFLNWFNNFLSFFEFFIDLFAWFCYNFFKFIYLYYYLLNQISSLLINLVLFLYINSFKIRIVKLIIMLIKKFRICFFTSEHHKLSRTYSDLSSIQSLYFLFRLIRLNNQLYKCLPNYDFCLNIFFQMLYHNYEKYKKRNHLFLGNFLH